MVLMLDRHLAMVRIASHRTVGNVSVVMCNYSNHELVFTTIIPEPPKRTSTRFSEEAKAALNVTTITIAMVFINLLNFLWNYAPLTLTMYGRRRSRTISADTDLERMDISSRAVSLLLQYYKQTTDLTEKLNHTYTSVTIPTISSTCGKVLWPRNGWYRYVLVYITHK